MDPYTQSLLDRLGDHDPIEVLQATPARLAELTERLGPSAFDEELRPGGWTFGETLAHLADVELGMGFRLRQALAGVDLAQGFDQDAWARPYPRLDPTLALEALRATRAWNLALLATMDLEAWLLNYRHPERGEEGIDMLVRTLAGHDLRHLDALFELFD